MNKKEMLLKLERLLEVLVKRKNNLTKKMEEIDDLPDQYITRYTYKEWHEVYCKVSYLELRIAIVKSKMQLLAEKTDIIRDVISGSKGLFNHLVRRAN